MVAARVVALSNRAYGSYEARDDVFELSEATANGSGVGFSIHQPEGKGDVVRCDNIVIGAEGGGTNLESGRQE